MLPAKLQEPPSDEAVAKQQALAALQQAQVLYQQQRQQSGSKPASPVRALSVLVEPFLATFGHSPTR